MAAHATPGLPARLLALRLLERIDEEGTWLSRALGAEAARTGLSSVDTGLVLTLCQSALRRRPALRFVINRCARKGKVPHPVQRVLEIGLVQVLFLDRVPDHAAVDLAVRSAKKIGHHRHSGLVNGMLRRVIREKESWLERIEHHDGGALLGPAPDAIFRRWVKHLGLDVALELQEALAQPAVVDARIDQGSLADWCEQLGAQPIQGAPERMQLPSGSPTELPGFAQGAWTIQDRNAARIVPLLPEGGRRIADLCAAPGGKTTQIARVHAPEELYAFELHAHRAALVTDALNRCALNAEVVVGDAVDLCVEYGPFDRIVLDAPCSGLGTLRRHPEIGTRYQLRALNDSSKTQSKLLSAAITALSPGGFLVYSVCSLEPEEGYAVIAKALASGGVKLVDDPRLPGGQGCLGLDGDGDGFFVAILEKC